MNAPRLKFFASCKTALLRSVLPGLTLVKLLRKVRERGRIHDPPTGKKERGAKKFSGSDLIQLAGAVVEKAPFLESYRHKTAGWKGVKEHLEEKGLRHTAGHDVIRQN